MKPHTPHSARARRAGLFLACLLAGLHTTAQAVDATVTARTQRFFPGKVLNVTKLDATKDLLHAPGHGLAKNAVEHVLVWSRGGISSSPGISRLYAGKGSKGLPDASADTTQLYGVRAVDANHLKLYNSHAQALADAGAFNLLGESKGYTPVKDVGIAFASSNWCWNACSQMIMDKAGAYYDQDDIADHAFQTEGVGRFLNLPNHLSKESLAVDSSIIRRGVARIVSDLADLEAEVQAPLSNERITQELTAGRPMIFQVGWYPFPKKPNERDGGHVFVTWGFDGTNLKIHDPWPSLGTQTLNMATFRANGYQTTGRWEAVLATGKSLDVVFLIDTTGSMSDDIANAKANATSIINNLGSEFKDFRIAVVEYRDFPQSPWGGSGDFITKVRTGFTSSTATAISAINAMTTGGGADWPEAVYSAACSVLNGEGIGEWRENPTNRMIIMMGDAPGHEPEPWAGGKSLADVLALANREDFPIRISGVSIGSDTSVRATFDTFAALTGGSSYTTATASGVSAAITAAINDQAKSTRFPRLETGVLKPKFTFPERLGPATEDPPSGITIQIQRMDLAKSVWKNHATATMPGTASTWTPPQALPIGLYRWRLTYKFPAGVVRSPTGGILTTSPARVVSDDIWTGFQRLPAIPGEAVPVSPASGFAASDKKVAYTFNTALHATSYAVEIWTGGKLWKKLTVAPPAKTPDATTLTATVSGHKPGVFYTWRVQGLNLDRPKPEADGWAP